MIKQILFVGLGGALGSVTRYLVAFYSAKHYSEAFPLSTFIINITGCILIGLFIGLAARLQYITPELKLFLVTGFCGGYTTFSTFSSENVQLFQAGHSIIMFLYIALSVVIGFFGVWLGNLIAKI